MADHIPFITSDDSLALAQEIYRDADVVRLPVDRAQSRRPSHATSPKLWIDPSLDGMHDLNARRSQGRTRNSWLDFMSGLPNFEKIGSPTFQNSPVASDVDAFAKAILDKCVSYKPAWITVPQIPLAEDATRNKINRLLAAATGKWRHATSYAGKLILPLVFTHQNQINRKTARNPKVQQAERCYHDAQAEGLWTVDQTLLDDSGSPTLRNKRLPGIVDLHVELNERLSPSIRIAGPYWCLNLVLWARGLVDYPAIGIGSGYRFLLSGGQAKPALTKLAIPSLRRRVVVNPELLRWLDVALSRLSSSQPAHRELSDIRKQYHSLSQTQTARRQVAEVYKRWFDAIASVPASGRPMALFQDLSAAYALGRSLPDLGEQPRRPESVAEQLMLSCL